MTDEEFQRIKEAEKDRLRAQKRLRSTLEALKRRNEVQSIVRRMSQGAKHLLRETEALAETLAEQAGRQAARLELSLEDSGAEEDLQEAEEALREERAEEIVRRLKSEKRHTTGASPGSTAEGRTEEQPNKPEKTIGRMEEPPSSGSES